MQVHFPPAHVEPLAQVVPQAPQLRLSLLRLSQAPLQFVRPALQVNTHVEPVHEVVPRVAPLVGPGQAAVQEVPQWFAAVGASHVPLHESRPCCRCIMPPEHVEPLVQIVPQAPQLPLSPLRLSQAPLQFASPVLQPVSAHVEPVHEVVPEGRAAGRPRASDRAGRAAVVRRSGRLACAAAREQTRVADALAPRARRAARAGRAASAAVAVVAAQVVAGAAAVREARVAGQRARGAGARGQVPRVAPLVGPGGKRPCRTCRSGCPAPGFRTCLRS